MPLCVSKCVSKMKGEKVKKSDEKNFFLLSVLVAFLKKILCQVVCHECQRVSENLEIFQKSVLVLFLHRNAFCVSLPCVF